MHGVKPNLQVVVIGSHLLSLHSCTAFIASFCSYGVYDPKTLLMVWTTVILMFLPSDKLSVTSVVSSPVSWKLLSSNMGDYSFQIHYDQSHKSRLLSVSAPPPPPPTPTPPGDNLTISYSRHVPRSVYTLIQLNFEFCQVVDWAWIPTRTQSRPSWTLHLNMELWG